MPMRSQSRVGRCGDLHQHLRVGGENASLCDINSRRVMRRSAPGKAVVPALPMRGVTDQMMRDVLEVLQDLLAPAGQATLTSE